jgi:hypothetical protein
MLAAILPAFTGAATVSWNINFTRHRVERSAVSWEDDSLPTARSETLR